LKGDMSWVCGHVVEEFLVVGKLLVQDFRLDKLLNEVPRVSFASGIFGRRGEGSKFSSIGATVYGGSVGPDPECKVLRDCSPSRCYVRC